MVLQTPVNPKPYLDPKVLPLKDPHKEIIIKNPKKEGFIRLMDKILHDPC